MEPRGQDFSASPSPEPLGADVWTLSFPLRFCGLNLGRRVTLLRISGSRLAVHSTAPFTPAQVREMNGLGAPAFLLDATTMHDTFSREARAALPEATYFVPEAFCKKAQGRDARALGQLDEVTGGEIRTARLDGMRFLNEYACFHPASGTLIVCDLLFNLVEAKGYTRWAMRSLLGVKQWPAMDRPVRMAVCDRDAFIASLRRIDRWDFDRLIVAHGSVIPSGGKQHFREALRRAGFDPQG